MIEPASIHADLIAYCARIGVAPTTFGQWVVRDFAFAASLKSGAAKIGKVGLAQRFMREHTEVPHRQFGAVAKAWRERIAAEGETGDGSGGEARHAGDPAAVAAAMASAASTAATLEESYQSHNQEFNAELSDPPGDPAAVAAILDRLGGDQVVCEGARVAMTALEVMRAEGLIWAQYQRPLAAFAASRGYALDPVTRVMRPVGRDFARSA